MSTFTTTLPPDDAFNAEPRYIVIDTATNTIFSPVSAQRIKIPIHGFAHRPSCSWAKLSPEMIQGLLQPAPVATDDGERERLRSSIRTAMNRIDAAKDMLDGAFDELTGGLLDGMEVKG